MTEPWMKWVAAFLVLVGSLWTGYATLDGRYAHSAEVQQRFDRLDRTLMQGQRQQLRREEVEYTQKALRQGGLTVIERKRLLEVRDAIEALDRDLRKQP